MGSICCCCPEDEQLDQINRNNSTKVYKQREEKIIEINDQNSSKTVIKKTEDLTENNSGYSSGQPNGPYKPASREEMAAAAERRAAQQQSRGSKGVVNLKSRSAELPDNPKGGLRWQVG